jgi:hypothetical protein
MSASLALQAARNRASMALDRAARPTTDRRQWERELAELERLCDEGPAPARQKVTPAGMSEVARAMAWLATRPKR